MSELVGNTWRYRKRSWYSPLLQQCCTLGGFFSFQNVLHNYHGFFLLLLLLFISIWLTDGRTDVIETIKPFKINYTNYWCKEKKKSWEKLLHSETIKPLRDILRRGTRLTFKISQQKNNFFVRYAVLRNPSHGLNLGKFLRMMQLNIFALSGPREISQQQINAFE